MQKLGFSLLIPALLVLLGCDNRRVDWTRDVSPVCRVHGTQMIKTNVPIEYGLFRLNEWGNALAAASSNNFPNAEGVVQGGCIVENATQAIIYVCAECQLARRHWESEHPRPRNYTEEFAAGEWIGLDTSWRGDVFRLILNPDRTGSLTEVPREATNKVSVYQYQISKWSIATNDALECLFSQRDVNEPLRLTGTINGEKAAITAILHNGDGGWTQDILFWRAKDLDEKMKILRQ